MLNLIEVEIDIIVGLISTNLNEAYRPIFGMEESNKTNNIFLLIKVSIIDEVERLFSNIKFSNSSYNIQIKHKINWFGKNLEDMFQKQSKLQQNIKFLEIELANMRKNCDANIKTQNYFLKNLENQNSGI